ncbi:hypothetical protein P171DRAFT_517050 [Karstenula rhodostoma CBS 690.94]|uniref:Uncharacterized protein n=1 Tax=Karstenula rhodostoma CBS 690.94 TaxID=1392251 RepID=A0A9P4PU58_9PLEO|nr:hypothetical protein P171DRAFT_517050 [Karstenula rhodostoma CBS 690.94]
MLADLEGHGCYWTRVREEPSKIYILIEWATSGAEDIVTPVYQEFVKNPASPAYSSLPVGMYKLDEHSNDCTTFILLDYYTSPAKERNAQRYNTHARTYRKNIKGLHADAIAVGHLLYIAQRLHGLFIHQGYHSNFVKDMDVFNKMQPFKFDMRKDMQVKRQWFTRHGKSWGGKRTRRLPGFDGGLC